jgi:hypothetical protein
MSFMELHDEAMAVVDEARAHERNGDKEGYLQLLRKACKLEEKAARLLDQGAESEPTRSVLFRSASSLAFQAEDYHQACTLAFEGLTGDTPEECITELLDIANDAKFRLRLREQDLRVAKSEITVIVRGPRVAIGLAPAKQATLMLRRIENLLRSCIEDFFRSKIAEVESDGQIESMKIFEVFLRQLPTEEFAVAFRLGLSEQLHLFGPVSLGDRIVTQFMHDLQVAVAQAPGADNRDKFTKAVAKLEPDGKEVTSIEINSLVAGELMSVRIPPKKQAVRETFGPEARRKPYR